MKNILLISPHSSAKTNESRYVSPAPGVMRIEGYLLSEGYYAEAFDPNLNDLANDVLCVKEKIKQRKWDVIGISYLEETLVKDMENMWSAKELCPGALLVAGGIEAQYNYQTILDKTPCNIVIIGEGEIPMRMICEEKPLHEIPGVVFKNNSRPLTLNQFEVMTWCVRWEDIQFEKYWDFYLKKYGDTITDEIDRQIHTIRVFSTNRCPFLCKFCTSSNQLSDAAGYKVKVVGMTPNSLANLIGRIYKAHPRVRTIYLTDDNFCLNKKNVIDFCKTIIRKGLDVLSYLCFARIIDLHDDMLLWMKKAGFFRLNIGIESFSNNVLREVGKKCEADMIHSQLQMIKDNDIQVFMTFMLITPGSTVDDLELTINNISNLIDDPFYTFGLSLSVRPSKGSEFYEMYYDFETYVTGIKNSALANGTLCLVKENKMIYAKDVIVKQIQVLYYNREQHFLKEFIYNKNVKHATFSNIAYGQVVLMQECIEQVRSEHGLKKAKWIRRLDQ